MLYSFEDVFTSKSIDIYDLNKQLSLNKDTDVDWEATATIEFTLEPSLRKWGFDGIDIYIKKLNIQLELKLSADELSENTYLLDSRGWVFSRAGDEYTKSVTLEISEDNNDWTFDKSDLVFTTSGVLMIQNIAVDLTKQTITLT